MSNLKINRKGPDLEAIAANMRALANMDILVGVPSDETQREDEDGLTNAALAYIHDNGAPEQHIPQREFMRPGINSVRSEINARLRKMAKSVTEGRMANLDQQAIRIGLLAKTAIQNAINEGIPPPLAESTLRARARRGRKGAQEELKSRGEGNPPSMGLAKPLIDSGQLRNSINYALRSKAKREE